MKKVIALIVTAALLVIGTVSLSIVAVVSDKNLSSHKDTQKVVLESYAEDKGQDNYTVANWAVVQSRVEAGKTSIDGASRKIQGRESAATLLRGS